MWPHTQRPQTSKPIVLRRRRRRRRRRRPPPLREGRPPSSARVPRNADLDPLTAYCGVEAGRSRRHYVDSLRRLDGAQRRQPNDGPHDAYPAQLGGRSSSGRQLRLSLLEPPAWAGGRSVAGRTAAEGRGRPATQVAGKASSNGEKWSATRLSASRRDLKHRTDAAGSVAAIRGGVAVRGGVADVRVTRCPLMIGRKSLPVYARTPVSLPLSSQRNATGH